MPSLTKYTGGADTRATSNPRSFNMRKLNNESENTNFIELNRRMQSLSRGLGKEQSMGNSSYRRHETQAFNDPSFPLTALKDDQSKHSKKLPQSS